MMNEKIKRQFSVLTLVALTGAFLGLSGCATTGQFDDLQRQINAVAADASAAKALAAATKSEAAATKSEAASANARANEAINAANSAINTAKEANARSIETETKIDRMFKKAMHK